MFEAPSKVSIGEYADDNAGIIDDARGSWASLRFGDEVQGFLGLDRLMNDAAALARSHNIGDEHEGASEVATRMEGREILLGESSTLNQGHGQRIAKRHHHRRARRWRESKRARLDTSTHSDNDVAMSPKR